ncbi:MAG: hypothetical protein ACSHXB_00450 [Sulfitobacter sp.]
MNWLSRNAAPLEALAAIVTALVAVVALIAIPWQIRATARLQAEQSAREIYREFVALSVQKPQFANPDYCALKEHEQHLTAYRYYVEYLYYTAEQVVEISEVWEPIMIGHLDQHTAFICDNADWRGDTDRVKGLIVTQLLHCTTDPVC